MSIMNRALAAQQEGGTPPAERTVEERLDAITDVVRELHVIVEELCQRVEEATARVRAQGRVEA